MPPVLQHISHATPLGAAVQALPGRRQGDWPHPAPADHAGRLRDDVRPGRRLDCSAGSEIRRRGVTAVPEPQTCRATSMPLSRRGRRGTTAAPATMVRPLRVLAVLARLHRLLEGGRGPSAIDLALSRAGRGVDRCWMFTLHPAWRERPRLMAVFFAGLIALIGRPGHAGPVVRVLHVHRLLLRVRVCRWPWRLPGVDRGGPRRGHRPGQRPAQGRRRSAWSSTLARPGRERGADVRAGLDRIT